MLESSLGKSKHEGMNISSIGAVMQSQTRTGQLLIHQRVKTLHHLHVRYLFQSPTSHFLKNL